MDLAGLWHGASWLFLLYGLYHGILLAATDWLTRRFRATSPRAGTAVFAQTMLTFYLVLMGYVLFRARSVVAAFHFFAMLHTSRAPSILSRDAVARAMACAAALVFCHVLDHCVQRRRALVERPWVMWPAMVVARDLRCALRRAAHPFIYFGF